ncbi:MAG: beta-ketoacyl synthase N-terminal-like domain-containing protein [Nannocystaceae bacterium]|nr:hypothetical protein [bacterium]
MSIAIAACGARTAVGLGAEATAAAVRAGISRLGLHPRFVDTTGDSVRLAYDASLDLDLRAPERMAVLGLSATEEALKVLGGSMKLGLYIAGPEPRPGAGKEALQPVSTSLTGALVERFEVVASRVFPFGHAAGASALQAATSDLAANAVEVALVVGVDSYVDHETLAWLDATRQLDHDRCRAGFTPGEGAAALVLVQSGRSRSLRLPELASIVGVGLAMEPITIDSSAPVLGLGLTAAMKQATAHLKYPQNKITTAYCDINGQRYRSEEFMYVPLRLWAPFVDANAYEAPADCWGDIGAASLPAFMNLIVQSGRRGYAKGPYNLGWASSVGGRRGATLLKLPKRKNA